MITVDGKRIVWVYSDYSVSFICDYMTIAVGVQVPYIEGEDDDDEENRAIKMADKIISDYYGFSPLGFCHETNVDYCGATL